MNEKKVREIVLEVLDEKEREQKREEFFERKGKENQDLFSIEKKFDLFDFVLGSVFIGVGVIFFLVFLIVVKKLLIVLL